MRRGHCQDSVALGLSWLRRPCRTDRLPTRESLMIPYRLRLPAVLLRYLDASYRGLLSRDGATGFSFGEPAGEPGLVDLASVSWRVFRNPVSVFIGRVAAVVLELAEPSVRTGVWEHSSFRTDPMRRLQRTGLAAMVTVYGARSVAEKMIAGVRHVHGKVVGHTASGQAYHANDVRLLNWVHVTAAFGFAEAYHRYASALSDEDWDRFYKEGLAAATLYGAIGAPSSRAEQEAQFAAMRSSLVPSDIVFEFLKIMNTAPLMPRWIRPLQRLLVRAAVDLVPVDIRQLLGLNTQQGLSRFGYAVTRMLVRLFDRVVLPSSPAQQAALRLAPP